ncbi:hypothetical protein [Ochrobactrum sp. SFR4]|uniref:hypothetical protein n=1 Tax=Ochrobactrum sp. SFR4 TaxID=2717368 RepID=UPI000EFB7582|nr:hypothetical protein [Ochrobactrum sp. SFR4]MBX8824586.1 hypothetical protein [Ochrobactrum sp. SFR4]
MLYHRFTIISLFALGTVFLSLLLMNENHTNRTGHLAQTLSHSFLKTEISRPAQAVTLTKSQEKEMLP